MKENVIAFMMLNPNGAGSMHVEGGKYNGYVGFKAKLPKSCSSVYDFDNVPKEILDDYVSVHGGITFDKNRLNDILPIFPITGIPEDFREYRIIGFDTLHLNDTEEYWTFERTKEETINLKKQIEKLINEKYSDK